MLVGLVIVHTVQSADLVALRNRFAHPVGTDRISIVIFRELQWRKDKLRW
jgi:hypothetical protein